MASNAGKNIETLTKECESAQQIANDAQEIADDQQKKYLHDRRLAEDKIDRLHKRHQENEDREAQMARPPTTPPQSIILPAAPWLDADHKPTMDKEMTSSS
jgi:hypothetical protein